MTHICKTLELGHACMAQFCVLTAKLTAIRWPWCSTTAQQLLHLPQRVLSRRKIPVLVDLLRGRHLGVTQDELGIASRHSQLFEQRGRGVAHVMNPDDPQPLLSADAAEGPYEGRRFHWRAGVGAQHQFTAV